MKRNVDLTRDGDFQKQFTLKDIRHIFADSFMKYPWSMDGERITSLTEKELVPTGNREERQSKRRWEKYEQGVECECCGRDLSMKPWYMYYTLCQDCNDRSEEYRRNDRELIKTGSRRDHYVMSAKLE